MKVLGIIKNISCAANYKLLLKTSGDLNKDLNIHFINKYINIESVRGLSG